MMYFVRIKGSLHGAPIADLDEAKKTAGGMLISNRSFNAAEIVPHVPGAIGGVGLPVATAKKNRSGKVVWSDPA